MCKKYLSCGEIYNQHVELQKTLSYIWGKKEEIKAVFPEDYEVVFLASGSSYWMSLSASAYFRYKTGKRASAVKAGDVVLCPEEYENFFQNPILVCPSRSGLTGEVLAAIESLRGFYPALKIISIVEYPDATLSKLSDLDLHIEWANEESVCQTRSFSCLYIASLLIADSVAGDERLQKELHRYLKIAPALYEKHGAEISKIINEGNIEQIVTLASGRQYGVCIEGAYIVIEMASHAANYYQLLEYRHGPIVTADDKTAVFIFESKGNRKYEEKIAREIRGAGAQVYVIGQEETGYANRTFALGEAFSREIIALHGVFCLQAFAYHYSVYKGKNPDCPGSLVPYIVI